MASSVAGHRRAFGADVGAAMLRRPGADRPRGAGRLQRRVVPPDPLPAHPDRAGRARHARRQHRSAPHRNQRGCRPAAVDQAGHRHRLMVGLAGAAAQHRAIDTEFINAHTQGFFEVLWGARALAPTIAATADATGLDARDIERFYDWFAATPRVVSCYSQGVNQSAQGTDKVSAILNCHLATGRIGEPGSGPLSLTGQPNAMGGREVGGLANMLAAHMGFSAAERDRVRRFWDAPNLVAGEGLKAVDMFEAVADGRIKALWIMGTNPAVSLPRADAMRDALAKLELLVVSENVASNDTMARAHIALPAAAWGEKDGTVTNSERCVSRQRAFLPLPGHARPDWWMLSQVARRLGYGEAFAYRSAAEIFDEHARLSGFENAGSRAFDISGRAGLTREAFDALVPFQWPSRAGEGTTERLLGDGRFFTPDGKARFVAIAEPRLSSPCLADVAVRSQHRPRARPVAHHDAYGALPTPLEPYRRAICRDPSRRRGADGSRAGRAGARYVQIWCGDGTCAGQQRAAARHAFRADPLVGREQLRRAYRRAGARGNRPILGPARDRRRRRRVSPRSPSATTAWPSRASRSSARASPIGPRLARRSGMSCTSRSMRRATGGCPGNARCCPRATPSPSPMPRPAPIGRPCCATAGSRPRSSSARRLRLPSPEWLKSQFERRRSPRPSAAPCWLAGRSRERRRKVQSSASASRSARRASQPPPARDAARSRRSERASAPAPTAAAVSQRSAA